MTRKTASEGVKSDVNRCLLRQLAELKVEIPYPQRVVHLSGASTPALVSA